MRKQFLSIPMCLFFCAAVNIPNLAADSLQIPSVVPVRSAQGQQVEGPFTLSERADYAILSNSEFASSTQGYGTYTDLVGPTFTVVAGSQGTAGLTLGSYQFAAGAPMSVAVFGTLSLAYTLYSVNPNSESFDPIADYISNDEVSQTVEFINQQTNAGPPLQATTPEPSSWALAAAGLLLVSCALLRKDA